MTLKVGKSKVYCLSQDPSGFSNLVKELSSGQSGRVADLPNSPPNFRELLGNNCSCTSVKNWSVLRILMNTIFVVHGISSRVSCFNRQKMLFFLIPTSKNCRCDFPAFSVVAKFKS